MHLLSFAKGALAMFWLLALANLFVPLGEAWFWPVNLAAAAVLLAHVGEVLLFRQRLQGRPQPWFQAKDMAEAAIRESGMEFAILRPSWIYGPRDRTRLKLTLRGKRLGLTLSEIKDLVDMYESPKDSSAQLNRFLAVLARHRESLEQQREDLEVTLAEIAAHEDKCRRMLSEAGSRTKAKSAATRSRRAA